MQKSVITICNRINGMTIAVDHVGKSHFVVKVDGIHAASATSLGEAHSKAQHIARAGRAAWLERLAFAA